MALTPRQEALYIYTVDIWRQDETVDADFQPYVLASSGVKCYFESTPEADLVSPVGRNKQVNILTMDLYHFELAEVIKDTDYIQMTGGPGGDLVGNWWAVQGGTRTHGYRANKQVVYAKQSEDPNEP